MVAGTRSGCGKTTICRGLMAAFTKSGKTVQPFKVGPDFIDPTHHTQICGRVSYNLDPFMMGEDQVVRTVARASRGADMAIIEGVMGLYDGMDGSARSSSAHVARILHAPVILVVDTCGMSRSVHALIQGFSSYDRRIRIAGVIFNNIASERHKDLIKVGARTRVFGYVPRDPTLEIGSRHLGLRMGDEIPGADPCGPVIARSCDLRGIFESAGSCNLPHVRSPDTPAGTGSRRKPVARIGVARDEAFCFHYQENLERLVEAGAALVPFSPLRDPVPAVDGLYLGGGYPELHLDQLSRSSLLPWIRVAAPDGIPVYAECGGLITLSESIVPPEGNAIRMAGVLPCTSMMTRRVQALGYTQGSSTGTSPWIPAGTRLRGHEFHYSRVETETDARFAFRLSRGKGVERGSDGLSEHCVVGTYTHAFFSRAFCNAFIRAAARYSHT